MSNYIGLSLSSIQFFGGIDALDGIDVDAIVEYWDPRSSGWVPVGRLGDDDVGQEIEDLLVSLAEKE